MRVLFRIGVVLSALWLLLAFADNYRTSSQLNISTAQQEQVIEFELEGFLTEGVLPVVLLWGGIWIFSGFKQSK